MSGETRRIIWTAMAGADKPDDAHASRRCRNHARHAVLDDDAARWRHAHPGCGVQEESGCWLAVRDLDGAEDMRMKAVVEPDKRQGVLQPLRTAARGDAGPANQRIEHLDYAGNDLQLALEERPDFAQAAKALRRVQSRLN